MQNGADYAQGASANAPNLRSNAPGGVGDNLPSTTGETAQIDAQREGTDVTNDTASPLSTLSAASDPKDAVQMSVERALGIENLTDDQRQLRRIGQQFGAKVEFANLDRRVTNPETGQKEWFSPDGYFDEESNTIWLNTSKRVPHNPVAYILKHELMHSFENDASYTLLFSAIMKSDAFHNYVREQGYETAELWAKDIVEKYQLYDAQYRTSDANAREYRAKREMAARFVGDAMFGGRTDITENLLNAMKPAQRTGFIDKVKAFFAKIKQIFQKRPELSEIERLEDLFLKTARQVAQSTAQNKTTANGGGVSYSFNDAASGMANDQLLPYDAEMRELIEQRGDYIIDSREKLEEIVDMAFNEPNKKATAYFGILSPEILSKIEKSVPNIPTELKGTLFKQDKSYSVAVTLDSIQHIPEDKKGITRQDVIDYLDRMADTIIDYDSVTFDWYVDDRKQKNKGLLFKKTFADGTIQSFEIVSNGRRSLKMQTIYMENASYIKKKTATAPPMQKAPAHTFETWASQSSTNNIPESKPKVNKNISTESGKSFSLPDTIDRKGVLQAVQDGTMTIEEADGLLNKAKKDDPFTIAQLKPEDANTTPDLGKPKEQGDGDGESKFYDSLMESKLITDEVKERIQSNTYIKNYGTTTNKQTLWMVKSFLIVKSVDTLVEKGYNDKGIRQENFATRGHTDVRKRLNIRAIVQKAQMETCGTDYSDCRVGGGVSCGVYAGCLADDSVQPSQRFVGARPVSRLLYDIGCAG